MKILVMSDSHGDRQIIQDVKDHWNGKVQAMIHCGDSELKANDTVWQGMTVVAGNMDWDSGYQDIQEIQVGDTKIGVTHGHLYNVGFGLDRLYYLAEELEVDVMCFGHIHRPVAQVEQGILLINPGSILQPRGEYDIKMYAIVDVTDEAFDIQYYTRSHAPISGLHVVLERG